jgi:hypothetical protein
MMADEFFCPGCTRMRPISLRVARKGRRDKCRSCDAKLAARQRAGHEKHRLSEGRSTARQYRKGRPIPNVE